LLTAFVLLAAGCDVGGDDSDERGRDQQGGDGGNGGGDGESEFGLDSQLDLGQAFAEDPMFDGALGPVTVNARADRSGEPSQIPITFRLNNAGESNLRRVAIAIRFSVVPGTDPEDPPVPAPDDPPLELAPQTTRGSCTSEDTTSSATTIVCTLGRLASGTEETITVTSPQWFILDTEMTLTARGG
jgi:hypothetical protein